MSVAFGTRYRGRTDSSVVTPSSRVMHTRTHWSWHRFCSWGESCLLVANKQLLKRIIPRSVQEAGRLNAMTLWIASEKDGQMESKIERDSETQREWERQRFIQRDRDRGERENIHLRYPFPTDLDIDADLWALWCPLHVTTDTSRVTEADSEPEIDQYTVEILKAKLSYFNRSML